MFKKASSKHDFIKMEEKWLDFWYKNGIIDLYLNKNKNSKKTFSFLDGPITANNPMGVHHGWGRTYKDLWQKFYNLLGYRQRFHNGFDCQGLWVEVEVEKELGIKNKREIENLVPGDKEASIAKFVELCKKRVYKYAKIQTEQSKRLGYFMDWKHSYFTMSDENNYMIWHFLKVCHQNGWIYKGRDVVPWCPRCQTAISQHEILTESYKEIVHDTVFFKLPAKGKDFSLLAWTTTPWTIPGNTALAVNSELDYALFENTKTNEKIVLIDPDQIQDEQVKKFLLKALSKDWEKRQKFKGSELVGLSYKGPFDHLPAVRKAAEEAGERFHTVVDSREYVTSDKGTGILHLAPAAGEEDFKIAVQNNLPLVELIDQEGYYLSDLGEIAGKNAKQDPEVILSILRKKEEFLLKIQKIRHRYPVCWRCKQELVWRLTDEWYIAMDKKGKDGKTLRQKMIEVAKKIKWLPEFGLQRELDWLEKMHDWLISKKNRYWGLSLPIWECGKCQNFEVVGGREELKQKAVEGWEEFEGKSPHKPYIDKIKIKCSQCGQLVQRISDVGNPWLDAGIVPFSTIKENNQGEPLYLRDKKHWREWFPADFITESFPGQFKNWFYALIAMSTVLENTNPFKTVLGFGTLLAEDGRPMHKSWGNSIEFNEGARKIGVDVMRWMYVKNNPADNLLFGYKKADEVRKTFYLKLWNSFVFFSTYVNLDKPLKEQVKNLDYDKLEPVDRWILNQLLNLKKDIEQNLKAYQPHKAAQSVEKFLEDLSNWYIRLNRDRLWVNSADKTSKLRFYQSMYYLLTNFMILLSPFLPFITEEIFTSLQVDIRSVHLASWPNLKEIKIDANLSADFARLKEIIEKARSRRKELKIKIRQPLKKMIVKFPSEYKDSVDQFQHLIKSELNVKRIDFKKSDKMQVDFDTEITKELKREGEVRELIRTLQLERKKQNLDPEVKVRIKIPLKYKNFAPEIKQKLNASGVELTETDKIQILK